MYWGTCKEGQLRTQRTQPKKTKTGIMVGTGALVSGAVLGFVGWLPPRSSGGVRAPRKGELRTTSNMPACERALHSVYPMPANRRSPPFLIFIVEPAVSNRGAGDTDQTGSGRESWPQVPSKSSRARESEGTESSFFWLTVRTVAIKFL